MPSISPAISSSTISLPNIPDELKGPITLDIIIEPVKTNCNTRNPHVFEKLALSHYFRTYNNLNHFRTSNDFICPLCKLKITEVVPDQEMATRIQNEFVNASQENKSYFEETKQRLPRDYWRLINQPVIPARETPVRLARQQTLQTLPPYQPVTSNSLLTKITNCLKEVFSAIIICSALISITTVKSITKTIVVLYETTSNKISPIFRNLIMRYHYRNDSFFVKEVHRSLEQCNLTEAEKFAEKIVNIELKNKSFELIAYKHIRSENLQEAEKIIRKITYIVTKDILYKSIFSRYCQNGKYLNAIKIIYQIYNMTFIEKLRLYFSTIFKMLLFSIIN